MLIIYEICENSNLDVKELVQFKDFETGFSKIWIKIGMYGILKRNSLFSVDNNKTIMLFGKMIIPLSLFLFLFLFLSFRATRACSTLRILTSKKINKLSILCACKVVEVSALC